MSIHLTDDAYEAVRELADAQGSSTTEVIRRALSLYVFIEKVRSDGGSLLISRADDSVERVHLL